jgi:steroid 5-alpha reductase family enzyme
MVVFYLKALAPIAVALPVLMTGAWAVQPRTGHSGWADTIRTLSLGLGAAGSALRPAIGLPVSHCLRRKERSHEFRFLDYRHRRARAAA